MNLIDSLDFLTNFTFTWSDQSAWIWALVTALIVFFGLGFFWGRGWNHSWNFPGHIGSAVLSLVFALLAAYGVLNWHAANQVEGWLEVQREMLIRSIGETGTYNRSVLKSAWDKLQPLGGQNNLASPKEGGNELRLNSIEEAILLTETAADEVKATLRSKAPFSWSLGLAWKDPSTIAKETAAALSNAKFPQVVTPSNDWTKSAAAAQTSHTLETLQRQIKQPMIDLKTAAFWLIVVAVVIEGALIANAALNAIKPNPKV